MSFKVYHLHGLGSSCEGSKARLVAEITERLGGEFYCFNIGYLKEGYLPWEVVSFLTDKVVLDKPTFLVGSSMGAYSWLDFLVNRQGLTENGNLLKAVLITPPVTLFDNLEKWNPSFEGEEVLLTYGDVYRYDYRTFVKLMHWDLRWAPQRLLTLKDGKVFSIVAKRDTVVDNGPIFELQRRCGLKVALIDDEHPLKNKLPELGRILEELFRSLLK